MALSRLPILTSALLLSSATLSAQVGSFTNDGEGCPSFQALGGVAYERFTAGDLGGSSLVWTRNADGWSVQSGPLQFVAGFSNNLNLSEDQVAGVTLSQPFPVPGRSDLTALDIDSNGRFGVLPSSSGSESVEQLLNSAALQFCPWWDDLSPDDGGGVFFDTIGGVDVITWNQLPQMLAGDQNTFQVQLLPNGDMVWSYQSGCDDDGLVGFCSGGPLGDPGPSDFSGGLPTIVNTRPAPRITALDMPEVGAPLRLVVEDLPDLAFLTAISLGTATLDLDLATFGAPGCRLLVDSVASLPTTDDQLALAIPMNTALEGAQFFFQSISFAPGANPLSIITSDRGTATVGGQPLIEVETDGPNSFNSDASSGFFRITNVSALPIVEVVFDFTASTDPAAQGLEFDTNQDGTNFDDGNGSAGGCSGGTYRLGSAALAGLVFAGTDVSGCDGSANVGAVRSNPVPGDAGSFRTLTFAFTSFTLGTTFEFDCDTDGPSSNTQNGADLQGMVVTIELQDGTILSGQLVATGAETATLLF